MGADASVATSARAASIRSGCQSRGVRSIKRPPAPRGTTASSDGERAWPPARSTAGSGPTRRRSPPTAGRCPARYNIAADVCDKHPRDKLAMVWEDWRGDQREVDVGRAAGPRQPRRQRAREPTACERGDRVAVVLPPTPETAAIFFGTWKLGAILLSMSVLYGDEGIRHRLDDSRPTVLVTDAENAQRFDPALVDTSWSSTTSCWPAPPTPSRTSTPPPTTPPSSTTPRAPPGLAKGILHAHRYLLAHEEFLYCHDVQDGELFHGMGEWAWAAGIAPLLGPWRLGATQFVFQRAGRLRSPPAARRCSPATRSPTSSRRPPRCAR